MSVDEHRLTLLGGRKAKRVTRGLVVVDQRVFEEFRKPPVDVVCDVPRSTAEVGTPVIETFQHAFQQVDELTQTKVRNAIR